MYQKLLTKRKCITLHANFLIKVEILATLLMYFYKWTE